MFSQIEHGCELFNGTFGPVQTHWQTMEQAQENVK